MRAELAQARLARRSVENVRMKLLSPTVPALDGSVSDLVIAIDSLRKLELGFASRHGRTPEWRRALSVEMSGLRRDLAEVNALLAGAARFYEGWGRLVSSRTEEGPANYTARGTSDAPVPIRSGRLVVHG